MADERNVHLRQRFIGKLKHLVYVVVLRLCEILFAVKLPVNAASKVVTTVSNALNLANLTHHRPNFRFCLIAQMRVADVAEIVGNLYFHVVADTFILFNARKELDKLVFVGLAKELPYHAEHTLNAFCKSLYLLFCF